jgi:hypothetical protein
VYVWVDLGLTPERRQRFGQDTFAEKKRLICFAADDLALFRSVNRRRVSPEVDRLIARARLILI